jgi:tetrathionate reductase subunit A
MLYMSAINYALPAAHKVTETLADPKKIPLIITSDILVGETSTYADYIFPDLSFLERWELHGTHPSVPWKVENVRNPAISIPGWPTVTGLRRRAADERRGDDDGHCRTAGPARLWPQRSGRGRAFHPAGAPLPEAGGQHRLWREGRRQRQCAGSGRRRTAHLPQARRHLPKIRLRRAHLESGAGQRRQPVAQGGLRHESRRALPGHAAAYKSDPTTGADVLVANAYGKQLNLYQEKTATSINTMTGKPFAGYAVYLPPGLSSVGEPIADEGYDLT